MLLINEDNLTAMKSQTFLDAIKGKKCCIVTDPPFNMGYHYKTYKDNKDENEYFEWLKEILTLYDYPFVVIHYPESLYKLSAKMRIFPERVVSWVYTSNTMKQHRDIAFFKVEPDFSKVRQPYKDPHDPRNVMNLAKGSGGARIYDWWQINQVKNKSPDKTAHPCQMPLEIMKRVVGILPEELTIIDPFMGSGTTGVACKELERDFIGMEIDKTYYEIAKERIESHAWQTKLF